MEAENTVWPCSLWARRPSTAKAFRGPRYERCALAYCRRRRWKVIARNRRWRGGEIDLLCRAKDRVVIVEVRGRASSEYLPRHTLSPTKRRRLFLYARGLRGNVTIVLLEVIGQLPRGRIATWCLGFWPELFGIRMRGLVIGE